MKISIKACHLQQCIARVFHRSVRIHTVYFYYFPTKVSLIEGSRTHVRIAQSASLLRKFDDGLRLPRVLRISAVFHVSLCSHAFGTRSTHDEPRKDTFSFCFSLLLRARPSGSQLFPPSFPPNTPHVPRHVSAWRGNLSHVQLPSRRPRPRPCACTHLSTILHLQRAVVQGSADTRDTEEAGAVSYTHLTLPTILLV